jgi:nitroimidazol reductase NimA-like FMN-containing flavoprotein (pyridoxamine 5'-phosphate oxidase superfamily)
MFMPAEISSAQVWSLIEKQAFCVIGFVTSRGEARTAGVVYAVRGRTIYFGTETTAWKTRHLERNPSISITVLVATWASRIPGLKIPPATITMSGTARVLPHEEVAPDIAEELMGKLQPRDELLAASSVVEATPAGDFLTYGVGVSLRTMLRPRDAGGRASVNA